jgi:DNA (cytosine-5)-methyltransferase 1
MLTVGSLFSGIGGIELGLEATGGFRTIWQVEIDPDFRRILEKHWPEVPKYGDITRLDPASLERPDLLAGGFPCQDKSTAGLRAGLGGTHSGPWREFLRLIRDLRPRYVLVEAEWASLYAYQFGYPHSRERCFIIAYPNGLGLPQLFDDLPSCPKPLRPGSLSRLDWYRYLLEEFEHRVRQPAVFRSPPGFPSRPQRLRVLGNAVMPEMARLVGECILRREARKAALMHGSSDGSERGGILR